MRTVIFPIVQDDGVFVYPDDIKYFSNTNDLGNGYMTADYSGDNDDIPTFTSIDTIEVHLDISGGDGQTPPGIENDGVEFVKILIECKLPDGSPAPLPDEDYRIVIRDGDENEYDIIKVGFIAGTALFNYRSNLRPATAHIDISDLSVPGADIGFTIVGDNFIKVYRSL